MSECKPLNGGYREGIEEGKGETVQLGFNRGFTDGAAAGLAYGQVRDTCTPPPPPPPPQPPCLLLVAAAGA